MDRNMNFHANKQHFGGGQGGMPTFSMPPASIDPNQHHLQQQQQQQQHHLNNMQQGNMPTAMSSVNDNMAYSQQHQQPQGAPSFYVQHPFHSMMSTSSRPESRPNSDFDEDNIDKPFATKDLLRSEVEFLSDRINEEIAKTTLQKDYESLETVTLLDSLDHLDSLFISIPGMLKDKLFLCSTLASLYRGKYESLFEKYKNLNYYFFFMITFLTFRGELFLKQRSNSSAYECKLGTTLPYRNILNRHKNLLLKKSFIVKNDRKEKFKNHPFFESTFYKENMALFDISKWLNLFKPDDFAILFVKVQHSMIYKKISENKTIRPKGLEIRFKTPIIAFAKKIKIFKFDYFQIEGFESFRDIIEKSMSYQFSAENLQLGHKQKFTWESVYDASTDACREDGEIGLIITNFLINATANNNLIAKYYTDFLYSNFVEPSTAVIESCMSIIDNESESRVKIIEDFQEKSKTQSENNDASDSGVDVAAV